jgi:CBS domain-containing protein
MTHDHTDRLKPKGFFVSFNDQKEFLRDICPFCELDDGLLEKAIHHIEIGFYPRQTHLIEIGQATEYLYLVIKGEVKAFDADNELIRVYHAQEGFDADALIEGVSQLRYEVTEDLICYELSIKGFMQLFEAHDGFRQFYLMDMVDRIHYFKKHATASDLSTFMVARVSDSYLHDPCIVPEETPIVEALKRSVRAKSSSMVVEKDSTYGIVTDSDIKNMLASDTLDLHAPIASIAHFPLIAVEEEDFLFNVYLQLIQRNIKRVGVMREGALIGMLEQIDVLSYFANHSHLVTVKIEKAKSIDALREASLDYLNIVRKLYAQGVKARYIAKLVSEINRKVFVRLFEMVVPEALRGDCALIVMGSEGRGEQIIRTDQDNGLIVRDGVDVEGYRPHMRELTETLVSFGYPLCEGNIMVSNPYWCKSESAYRAQIDQWIGAPEMESFMEFSIFFDAQCVAGDATLLDNLQEHLFAQVNRDNDVYLARFAQLTTLFETPVGFFSTFLHRDRRIDLKKAGIFPIVQGMRALSLHYGVTELSTVERIKRLTQEGILEKGMARELVEAFEVLFYLRLTQQLDALNRDETVSNTVTTDHLTKIQRDLLKDSLQIVEQFKRFIVRHFSLENLG